MYSPECCPQSLCWADLCTSLCLYFLILSLGPAPHFEDVLISGVGQCPTLGWGLWLVLCALGNSLTHSGLFGSRTGGNQQPYGMHSAGRA